VCVVSTTKNILVAICSYNCKLSRPPCICVHCTTWNRSCA